MGQLSQLQFGSLVFLPHISCHERADQETKAKENSFYRHHVRVTTSDRGFKSRLSKASLASHKSDLGKMGRGRGGTPPPFQGSGLDEPNLTPAGLKPGEVGAGAGQEDQARGLGPVDGFLDILKGLL